LERSERDQARQMAKGVVLLCAKRVKRPILFLIYRFAIKIIDKKNAEFDLPSLEKEISIMKEVLSQSMSVRYWCFGLLQRLSPNAHAR